jgi:site-specific DNA-methyltransferase (adenine-specific)
MVKKKRSHSSVTAPRNRKKGRPKSVAGDPMKDNLLNVDSNKIYLEDCIDFMTRLAPKSIDVIVTSPPYNLRKPYSKYEDNRERKDYLDFLNKTARLAKEVLKDEGSFFLNIGGKPSDPWLAFDVAREFENHFVLQNMIHWIKHVSITKDNSTRKNGLNGDISFGHFKPINTNTYLNQCQEYIFHFTKTGKVQLDKLAIGVPYQHKSNVTRWRKKGDLRDRGNVWFIKYENKQGAVEPILHPAIFPEKLPYLCIKLHGVKEGLVVYDPFMGIGTTAVACLRLGVDYIGTEIDKSYVDIAEKRIKERKKELSQLKIENVKPAQIKESVYIDAFS